MCLIVIKRELAINAAALLKCNSLDERIQLIIQRSNLKDMLIEILEKRAA